MQKKRKVFIIGIHQSHAKAYAGGYIRLREFLRHIPSIMDYTVIDIAPTIYGDIIDKKRIVTFPVPPIIKFFLKIIFPLGVFSERIWVAFVLYNFLKKKLQKEDVVVYVPIAEFIHLYLPPVILRQQFTKLRLVIDILNFYVYENGFVSVFKDFRKKAGILMGAVLAFLHYFSFQITKKTINIVDYIFSVSPELVKEINKIYFHKTINFTPSGVSVPKNIQISKRKKYTGVYIGRVTEQKGIFNLLKVWQELIKHLPKAKLAIAGLITPDIDESLQKRIKEYRLENNVIILGKVSEKEKFEIISSSEIFLHLANYEPLFPVIGILEGCAMGLPVIVYDMPVVASQNTLTKEKSLFVVQNGEYKQVVKTFIKIYSLSSQQKSTLSKKAKAYAAQYNWKKISQKEWKIVADFVYNK